MKTLIVYDKETNKVISYSQFGNFDIETIITDIPNDRVPIEVNGDEVILDDTKEVKEIKEKLSRIRTEEKKELEKLLDLELRNGVIL